MIRQRATAMASIANRGRLFGPTLNFFFLQNNMAEVMPPQIQFSRASAGWRYNSAGLLESVPSNTGRFNYDPATITRKNLCLFSQDWTNAAWGKLASGTGVLPVVTKDYAQAPDGTMTASRIIMSLAGGTTTADFSRIAQVGPATVAGTVWSQGVWVKTADGSTKTIRYRDDRTNMFDRIETITGEWKQLVAAGTVTAQTQTIGMNGLWIRGNQGTSDYVDLLVWGAQLNSGPTLNGYLPTTDKPVGDAKLIGLLVESARTNLIFDSETSTYDASTPNTPVPGSISGMNGTVVITGSIPGDSPNKRALPGTLTEAGDTVAASLMFDMSTLTGQTMTINALNFDVDGVVTLSCVFNRNTGLLTPTAGVNGTVLAYGMDLLEGNLRRLWVVGTYAKAGTQPPRVYGYAQGGTLPQVLVGCFTLEKAPFPGSYIPTTTAPVTRARDDLLVPVAPWFNSNEGTCVFEGVNAPRNGTPRIGFQLETNIPNRILGYVTIGVTGSISSTGQTSSRADFLTSVTPSAPVKFALYYKRGDSGIVSPIADTPMAPQPDVLPSITRLILGGRIALADGWDGHITRFRYYPRRVPTPEIKGLFL